MSIVKFNKRMKIVIQSKIVSLHYTVLFLFIVSLCFIISSIFIYSSTSKSIKNTVKTEAIIVSIINDNFGESRIYHVFIEYRVDNKKYNNELNTYKSNMEEGDSISIRYQIDNPNSIIYAKNDYLFFWSFFSIGLITLFAWYYNLRSYRKLKRLSKNKR